MPSSLDAERAGDLVLDALTLAGVDNSSLRLKAVDDLAKLPVSLPDSDGSDPGAAAVSEGMAPFL